VSNVVQLITKTNWHPKHGVPVLFPFLRTFKPLLKAAQRTPFYADIRQLLKLWLHGQHMTRLFESQSRRLYTVARERDMLLWKRPKKQAIW